MFMRFVTLSEVKILKTAPLWAFTLRSIPTWLTISTMPEDIPTAHLSPDSAGITAHDNAVS